MRGGGGGGARGARAVGGGGIAAGILGRAAGISAPPGGSCAAGISAGIRAREAGIATAARVKVRRAPRLFSLKGSELNVNQGRLHGISCPGFTLPGRQGPKIQRVAACCSCGALRMLCALPPQGESTGSQAPRSAPVVLPSETPGIRP